ncbi:UvrD-helicase domain-containing protein [bacterium]|nr:UvrD-helicase domain-containing protein [bacterium]
MENFKNKILSDLNPEQKRAVVSNKNKLLIIAGAGTGKTTVITRRIAYLILAGKAKAEEILAVTFTEKAAEEMEDRLDRLLPYGYVDLWVSTFHSFCERILRNHALEIGLSANFKILSEIEQLLLILQNFQRFDLDYYRPLGNPTKFIKSLVKHFSRAKDELISPEEYNEYAESIKLNYDSKMSDELLDQESSRLKEIARAYHTYQQLLLENDSLDFGDLINYTVKLFKKRPQILKEYQEKFKYILVDEFQDTNWAQYELLKLLVSTKNSLTVVADDDQSIYKFRGASYNNVIQFKKDFPKSEEIVLVKNYRSKQNILDLAYKFIQLNNPNRLEAQLNDKNGPRIIKKLQAVRKGKAEIRYYQYPDQVEEARGVVNKIIEIKERDKKVNWNDFAILVRANNQADVFVQALRFKEIPYQFLASQGLYAQPVILDILSYLKLLDNYHESSALYRILTSPIFKFKLSNEDLVNLNYWGRRKGISLYESLKNVNSIPNISEKAVKEINKFMNLIQKHSLLAREKSVGKIIFSFLEDTGYLKILSKRAESGSLQGVENINLINQLFKQVEKFEKISQDKSVASFMKMVETSLMAGSEGAIDQGFFEAGPESVKVTTVHGAKGLEFSYVFIVGLVDRRFPTIERHEQIELPEKLIKEIIPKGDIHLQEERRLFYVAMTRAKDGLFFTSAQNYGGLRKKKPSRFLYEIGFVKDLKEKKKSEKLKIFKPSIIEDGHIADKDLLPTEFSFSQLRAYETCPLQYKYAFVLKIHPRGKFTFSFGQTMHKTLYRFFQAFIERKNRKQKLFSKNENKNFPITLKELLKIYEEEWIDEWYPDIFYQKKYKNLGKKILQDFYAKTIKNPPHPLYLEREFNFKVGNVILKGKIDRIDLVGKNEIENIDYKTGEPKEKLNWEDKEQLLIYQVGGEKLFYKKIKKLRY